MARTITFFGCVPVTMNPPMSTLSPVSTRKRVEMFSQNRWVRLEVQIPMPRGARIPTGIVHPYADSRCRSGLRR